MIIAVCGCMMEQEHVAEKIRQSYPYVNLVFGTHVIHRLPQLLHTVLATGKRVFERGDESADREIVEGLPISRDRDIRGWLTVMYGCDNFCSYSVWCPMCGGGSAAEVQRLLSAVPGIAVFGLQGDCLVGAKRQFLRKKPR